MSEILGDKNTIHGKKHEWNFNDKNTIVKCKA